MSGNMQLFSISSPIKYILNYSVFQYRRLISFTKTGMFAVQGIITRISTLISECLSFDLVSYAGLFYVHCLNNYFLNNYFTLSFKLCLFNQRKQHFSQKYFFKKWGKIYLNFRTIFKNFLHPIYFQLYLVGFGSESFLLSYNFISVLSKEY